MSAAIIKDWMRISLILCTFGFFREMRPSEPFVTEFLSGGWRNITTEQVNKEIYPMGTYSYLAQLVIVFLITDIMRYKPIIVISACVGIILWSLLLWTYTMLGLQLVQICYGFFMAAEIAYYTYIYAKVERNKYQQVTGQTRSAILSGRFLASVIAQLIVSYKVLDLRELNYISLVAQIISLGFALMLPPVGNSLYFFSISDVPVKGNGRDDYEAQSHITATLESNQPSQTNGKKQMDELAAQVQVKLSWRRAIDLLWFHFCDAYSKPTVLQWSIWWSLAMCGFLLVQSYVQLLWQAIDKNQENFYNGAVEAVLTLLSALGAFFAGFFNNARYQKWDLWILTACSAIEGGLILYSGLTKNIWVAYIAYILFGTLYNFMITIASATVAKKLHEDSFGLIFGINTLLALVFQTIFTVIAISDTGYGLTPTQQFVSFGCYFIILSVFFAATSVFFTLKNICRRKSYTLER